VRKGRFFFLIPPLIHVFEYLTLLLSDRSSRRPGGISSSFRFSLPELCGISSLRVGFLDSSPFSSSLSGFGRTRRTPLRLKRRMPIVFTYSLKGDWTLCGSSPPLPLLFFLDNFDGAAYFQPVSATIRPAAYSPLARFSSRLPLLGLGFLVSCRDPCLFRFGAAIAFHLTLPGISGRVVCS